MHVRMHVCIMKSSIEPDTLPIYIDCRLQLTSLFSWAHASDCREGFNIGDGNGHITYIECPIVKAEYANTESCSSLDRLRRFQTLCNVANAKGLTAH